MCDWFLDIIENKYLVTFDFILIIAITIIHFVFYFQIKKTDLDFIFKAFDSSPLFDFSVDSDCGTNSHVIFHTWEGLSAQTKTNIEKINGKYFCYKKILYKDLLYNGQIIKKEENCPEAYNKICGIIDTLEQQLCIKYEENCPLYDIGIGIAPNNEDYETQGNIYYNKNAYNPNDKKIIEKLILNEGQPCYNLNEKLWRKFIPPEVGDGHLKCELEIFNKLNDERYERKGDITYDELYQDNLGSYYDLFIDKEEELKSQKVSLYKREFLGINKLCDENKEISKDSYDKLRKNQGMIKVCLLIEVIITFSVFILFICFFCLCACALRHGGADQLCYSIFLIFLIICLSLYLVCIICQSIFLGRIIKHDFDYDCSDEITNEILRKENKNTKTTIKYIAANLGLDIFFILFITLRLIIYIKKECESNWLVNEFMNDNKKNNDKNIVSKYKSKEEIKEVVLDNKTSNSNEN